MSDSALRLVMPAEPGGHDGAPVGLVAVGRPGRRRALLVGINEYPHQPLRGCINDVQDVVEFLQTERGFAASEITVLRNGEATRVAILRELGAVAAASRRGDTLVFYFCGHGAQLPTLDPNEADGLDEVLCPVDFDWTPASAIIDNELERIFDAIADGVDTTWVFDACHSGDIDEALDQRVAGCRALTQPAELAAAAYVSILPTPGPTPGPALVPRSLCRLLSRDRGVILTACAATEKAADIIVDDQPRGAFSYFLLRAARQLAGATASEVLVAVRNELASIGQRPEGYGPGLSSPFIRTVESNMNPKDQTRTVPVADTSSVEADRHLHMYLAEASRQATLDREFGSRMSELGVDLSSISPGDALALARAVKPAPRSGGMSCRTFWWGFHLEIPQLELETLTSAGIDHLAVVRMIAAVPRRVVPHVGSLVDFVLASFESIKEMNRGAGVFVSMSSFAPDMYVATPIPVRVPSTRRTDREPSESCAIRM